MMLKGWALSDSFYPFVENGAQDNSDEGSSLEVRYPARIAVFDDAAAAPRVVVVEPADIRTYLEEITATVTRLASEQGGKIPFTVIREVVENLIHAYFIEPTISILDGGNTIRFSDQGPGIQDKGLALKYGTTSATAEMKRYIRGVGSGLPYAQQWLQDKGGSLTVEDNIHNGTVVTVSLVHGQNPSPQMPNTAFYQQQYQSQYQGQYPAQYQAPQQYWQPQQQPWQQPQPYGAPNPWNQQMPAQTWGQQMAQQTWQQGVPMQTPPQAGLSQQMPAQFAAGNPEGTPVATSKLDLNDRELLVIEYLRTHESVGPRDLVLAYQLSESTWSRVLSQLETRGLLSKQGGQKRFLTPQGKQLLGL